MNKEKHCNNCKYVNGVLCENENYKAHGSDITEDYCEYFEMDQDSKQTGCESCEHCVALGEGDFACIENDEPVLVIEGYEHTKEYCYCINL